jgi:site-specific DNA-methyltransferase (adenine-specific)
MPESVTDRFCKSHEFLFLFVKQGDYYFDHEKSLEEATGYDGRGVDAGVCFGEAEALIHNRDAVRSIMRWPQRGYAVKPDKTGFWPQHHGDNYNITPFRTKRDVWTIATEPSFIQHYAMFPQKLVEPCISCGCPEGGVVLDPFMGSGTTAVVAKKLNRNYLGIELNPEYARIAKERIADVNPLFDVFEEREELIA